MEEAKLFEDLELKWKPYHVTKCMVLSWSTQKYNKVKERFTFFIETTYEKQIVEAEERKKFYEKNLAETQKFIEVLNNAKNYSSEQLKTINENDAERLEHQQKVFEQKELEEKQNEKRRLRAKLLKQLKELDDE